MVGLVLVGKLHRGGCVIQRSEQILFHVSDRAAVLCKALQHKADMVSVQLIKRLRTTSAGLSSPAMRSVLRLVAQVSTSKIYDLIDGILVVRAEPEQKVYLQRLRKNILPVGCVCSSHPLLQK